MNDTEALGKPHALCTTCGDLGIATTDAIGIRFECPNADRFNPHVAYVVADEGITSWMRVEAFLLAYQRRLSPLRRFSIFRARNRKGRVGSYSVARCGLLALSVVLTPALRHSLAGSTLLCGIAAAAAFDIVATHTSGVFTSRWPAHPLRAVWLSFFAYFQLALCFAVVYALRPGEFNRLVTPWEAVYFSVVTLATVGYGDISPCPRAYVVQAVVVAEILVGLYFLGVLLAQVVTWVADRPQRSKTLRDVLAVK